MPLVLKALITAVLVLGISEFSKRSTFLGSVLASLPITSILAMIWPYRDTGELHKVAELSRGIFWAVLPSLAFFQLFPFFVSRGLRFGASLGYLAFLAFARKVFL